MSLSSDDERYWASFRQRSLQPGGFGEDRVRIWFVHSVQTLHTTPLHVDRMTAGQLYLVHNPSLIRRRTRRWTLRMKQRNGATSQWQTPTQTNGRSSWTRTAASYYTLVVRNDTVDIHTRTKSHFRHQNPELRPLGIHFNTICMGSSCPCSGNVVHFIISKVSTIS